MKTTGLVRKIIEEIMRTGNTLKATALVRKIIEEIMRTGNALNDSFGSEDHRRNHAHRQCDEGERVAMPAVRKMERNRIELFTQFLGKCCCRVTQTERTVLEHFFDVYHTLNRTYVTHCTLTSNLMCDILCYIVLLLLLCKQCCFSSVLSGSCHQ